MCAIVHNVSCARFVACKYTLNSDKTEQSQVNRNIKLKTVVAINFARC